MQRFGISARSHGCFRHLAPSSAGSSRRFSSFSGGADHDDFWTSSKNDADALSDQQSTDFGTANSPPQVDGSQEIAPMASGAGQIPMGQAYGPPQTSRSNYSHSRTSRDLSEFGPPKPVFDMMSSMHLSPVRQVAVRSFRGTILVDIRQFTMNDKGLPMPLKKGISLTLDQWRRLQDAMGEIDKKLEDSNTTTKTVDPHEGGDGAPGERVP